MKDVLYVLSIVDMAVLSGIALIVFGPERLPGVAFKVGRVVRELRSASNAFVGEMERAAAFTSESPRPSVAMDTRLRMTDDEPIPTVDHSNLATDEGWLYGAADHDNSPEMIGAWIPPHLRRAPPFPPTG